MATLDDDQIEALVNAMVLTDFDAGETIIAEGGTRDFFYVLDQGVVDIAVGNTVVSTYQKGRSFGEQAMMFGTRRSGSARAKTQVSLWGISADDFEKVLASSSKQRELFQLHASAKEKTKSGEEVPVMTYDDFVRSLGVENSSGRVHAGISKGRLQQLFELADRNGNGKLGFDEYSRFMLLISRPEPEYDVAFMIFDRNKDGLVDKDEFAKAMSERRLFASLDLQFDSNCNLVQRYFGLDGKRKLRFGEFAQFFTELQFEVLRQAFLKRAGKDHFLSMDSIVSILTTAGRGTIPRTLMDRLAAMPGLSSTSSSGQVSYPEFCALLALIERSVGVTAIVRAGSIVTRHGLERDSFKTAAASMGMINLSPLAVEVLYAIADPANTGRLRPADLIGLFVDPSTSEVTQAGSALLGGKDAVPGAAPTAGSPLTLSTRIIANALMGIKHFALGALAGGIGSFAVYPIDLVKTRMQAQRTVPGATILYKNSFDCFAKVAREEGIRGLYRGIGPQLLGVAPEKAIKLTVNDMCRSAFADPTKGGEVYFPLEILSGACAGASQVLFTNPVEIVKIRLQLQMENVRLHGAVQRSAWSIVKELGFAGLYKGVSACLARDIPFSAIYFPVYGIAKDWMRGDSTDSSVPLTWQQIMAAGALAGAPAAFLVTPADVIKTRLQQEARKGESTYRGIADCARKIWSQEGPTAFFKGGGARVFRSSPQFGVTLVAYEMLHRWLTPDLESRPPTNAPVSPEDIPSFGDDSVAKKLRTIDEKLSRLRA